MIVMPEFNRKSIIHQVGWGDQVVEILEGLVWKRGKEKKRVEREIKLRITVGLE